MWFFEKEKVQRQSLADSGQQLRDLACLKHTRIRDSFVPKARKNEWRPREQKDVVVGVLFRAV
jgi:hypothetical protein